MLDKIFKLKEKIIELIKNNNLDDIIGMLLDLNMPNMNTKDVMWKAPESAPVYVLTVKIGDIEETFRLEPASE